MRWFKKILDRKIPEPVDQYFIVSREFLEMVEMKKIPKGSLISAFPVGSEPSIAGELVEINLRNYSQLLQIDHKATKKSNRTCLLVL